MNQDIIDGGSAYPHDGNESAHYHDERYSKQKGMTLRDKFAGDAMIGILSGAVEQRTVEMLAHLSYTVADAMIERRKK